MRSLPLAALLGLSLAGCVVGDTEAPGPGGGDDPGTDPGSGSGPGSGSNNAPAPKLELSVDKPTVATELFSTNLVTVSLHGSGGFAGPVTLTASAVDGAGGALPNWGVTLDKSTVDIAADGTSTVVAMLKVPSDTAAVQGMVKIAATSSLGATMTSSSVTVAKQLTVVLTLDNNNCVYPPEMVGTVKVAAGTKIRWK